MLIFSSLLKRIYLQLVLRVHWSCPSRCECCMWRCLPLHPGRSFPPLWGAIALFTHSNSPSFFNNAVLLWFLLPWLQVSCSVTMHSRHSLHLISIREFFSLWAWISHKSSLISGSRSYSKWALLFRSLRSVRSLLRLPPTMPLQHQAGSLKVLEIFSPVI